MGFVLWMGPRIASGAEDPATAACLDRDESESCEYLSADGESTIKGECASYTCSGEDMIDADCFSCVRTDHLDEEEGGCTVSRESRNPWIPVGLAAWFLTVGIRRRS